MLFNGCGTLTHAQLLKNLDEFFLILALPEYCIQHHHFVNAVVPTRTLKTEWRRVVFLLIVVVVVVVAVLLFCERKSAILGNETFALIEGYQWPSKRGASTPSLGSQCHTRAGCCGLVAVVVLLTL